MDELVPPQIYFPTFPIPPFVELLLCSYTLVLYENKSQGSGDDIVSKPAVKPVFEETKVGSHPQCLPSYLKEHWLMERVQNPTF